MFGNCDWCRQVENLVPRNDLWLCMECDSEAEVEENNELEQELDWGDDDQ